MAQILMLRPPIRTPANNHCRHSSPSALTEFDRYHLHYSAQFSELNHSWNSLQQKLKCRCRFSCLFSGNNKQEQARKALENALGGKKTDFEKWDKEIKRREEASGGGSSGGGGWFRWLGGSDGDHFWQEAQQAILTILGIIAMYLIVAKGDLMIAVVFNPLLFTLRGARNGLSSVTSQVMKRVSPMPQSTSETTPKYEVPSYISAKESVVRKWGSD